MGRAMCDDHADLWKAVWREARRPHRCGECGYAIRPGTRYLEIRTLFDGRWDTGKRCQVCDAHWQFYRRFNDGCEMAGGLTEYEHEFQVDAQDMFVVLGSSVAECMKEQA